MSGVTPPVNVTQLNDRLAQAARELGIPVARARVMLCTLIVSQMLPDAVAIKGGMGIKLRLGERGTRATSDLDVSTRSRGEEFEQVFRARLAKGWGAVPPSKGEIRRSPDAPDRVAFTASVRAAKLHDPGLTRPEYVMHPYRVSISSMVCMTAPFAPPCNRPFSAPLAASTTSRPVLKPPALVGFPGEYCSPRNPGRFCCDERPAHGRSWNVCGMVSRRHD